MFSFLVALVIAFILYKPVSNLVVQYTSWDESLTATIKEIIIGQDENAINQEKVNNAPDAISNYINSAVQKATSEAKTNIAESVSYDIAVNIIKGATALVLFLVANVILFFLRALSDILTNLPIIKQFNHLGGLAYGLIEGLLVIYLLLGIISIFFAQSALKDSIISSYIGNWLYHNNILLMIFF